ncbi:hypothetical protein [Secundilactobacillus paracollinoides]|uniref:hypothetical protein n=1 Tax=Secundilactobacillus paracollinoides TaxID=240427 RepID=UPI0006D21ECB|nr:hypothetical protein [Secundilactobacillus paracollinoides]
MRRQVRQRWEWCLIVSAVCFLVLMGLVAAGVTHGLDQDILNAIRAFKTTQHTRVITGITNTGGPTATLIETLVIAVILVLRRQLGKAVSQWRPF